MPDEIEQRTLRGQTAKQLANYGLDSRTSVAVMSSANKDEGDARKEGQESEGARAVDRQTDAEAAKIALPSSATARLSLSSRQVRRRRGSQRARLARPQPAAVEPKNVQSVKSTGKDGADAGKEGKDWI